MNGRSVCNCWYSRSGIPVEVVRPFHAYGPGMLLDAGRVFADLVADVVLRRPVTLKSHGEAKRAFCYVADATAGFFVALPLGRNGEAYNVAESAEESVKPAERPCRSN
jgi:nucleoside-diphosphate-sugar epimerase